MRAVRGRDENWAPGQIQASFSRSAKLYDRAAKRGDIVAVPFGRYLLLERIKRGGMAEVYRAKVVGTEGFEKIVAIKRILPHLAANEDFVTMFIDEAKIVSILNHQNICPVIELGRCEDGLYIVMEYIWGRDLRQILNSLARSGRLMPLNVAAYIAGRIAEGLDYAHRRVGPHGEGLNIVHRDISPQNVLISYDGEVKIIDFGIARASQRSTQTRAGTFKGKFAYMSPEQARGKELDRRSDIFALGILLHEMVTGSRLFAAKNDLDTLERVRNCQVPFPTRPFEEVQHELQQITMRALHPERDERFQWAGELQLALDRFLMRSGELATASRLGTWICLNFAEQAAKALVDQERAARAQPPGSSPQYQATPPVDPSQPVDRHSASDYGHSTSDGSTDASFSTTEVPEGSASGLTAEADVEFEVDDGLFVFNESDDFLKQNSAEPPDGSQPVEISPYPSSSPEQRAPGRDWPRRDSRPSWALQAQDHPSWVSDPIDNDQDWSPKSAKNTGNVVPIPEVEGSHPEIRDTVQPNPQTAASSAPEQPEVNPLPRNSTPPPARTDQEGITISSSVDIEVPEDDLIVLDDLPPSKPGSGQD